MVEKSAREGLGEGADRRRRASLSSHGRHTNALEARGASIRSGRTRPAMYNDDGCWDVRASDMRTPNFFSAIILPGRITNTNSRARDTAW